MSDSWAKKNPPSSVKRGVLAPQWYVESKQAGATPEELFELVKAFCVEHEPELTSDALVELMITSYEA